MEGEQREWEIMGEMGIKREDRDNEGKWVEVVVVGENWEIAGGKWDIVG